MIKQIAMVTMLGLAIVLATAVYTQHATALSIGAGGGNGVNPGGSTSASQFAPGQEVKSGEDSTAKSAAPGQQAAVLGGNGATYAPGQEAKKPTCASVITNQC